MGSLTQISSLADVYAAAFIGCFGAIFVYQVGHNLLWRFFWTTGSAANMDEVKGPDASRAKTCDKCGCVYMPDLSERPKGRRL